MEKNLRHRKPNKGKLTVNKGALATLVIFIVVADIFLLFSHSKVFSEKENRVLQQAPKLTFSTLTDGSFMEKEEKYISDQIFFRDGWIAYKYTVDRILGKRNINGVWIGKKGYLIEDAVMPNEERVSKSLEAINAFASIHDLNTVVCIVPNAVSILKKYLPKGAMVYDQSLLTDRIKNGLSETIKFVDVTEPLKEASENQIYYKSDHHWTSFGAKTAFDSLAETLGILSQVGSIEDLKGAEYDIYRVTENFSGTMASATGASVTDRIEIFVPQTDLSYVVEYTEEGTKSATVYSSAALETNSKYDVFLGGNHTLIKINTLNRNKKNLLILKDSYANCLVQFLVPYYQSITIVDPRYYSGNLNGLMDEQKITDVLFLYNLNTFAVDNSLAGVLTDGQ